MTMSIWKEKLAKFVGEKLQKVDQIATIIVRDVSISTFLKKSKEYFDSYNLIFINVSYIPLRQLQPYNPKCQLPVL